MTPARDDPDERDEDFGVPRWQLAGLSVLLGVLLLVLNPLVVVLLLAAAAVVGMLVSEFLKVDDNDELPPASSAFLELADPRRPLAADDRISSARIGTDARQPRTRGEVTATHADPQRRGERS